jgi:hypothetical protein
VPVRQLERCEDAPPQPGRHPARQRHPGRAAPDHRHQPAGPSGSVLSQVAACECDTTGGDQGNADRQDGQRAADPEPVLQRLVAKQEVEG